MIRVVYTFPVRPGHEQTFAAAWHAVTAAIRAHVEGARGSLLLRDPTAPHEFTAIARWTSRTAWEAFQSSAWSDPTVAADVQAMRDAISGPRSQTIYEEVDDLTVTDPPSR